MMYPRDQFLILFYLQYKCSRFFDEIFLGFSCLERMTFQQDLISHDHVLFASNLLLVVSVVADCLWLLKVGQLCNLCYH